MIWYTRLMPLILMAIAAITGILFLKKQTIGLKLVTVICIFNFVSDLIGNLIGLYNLNNHWLYNVSDFLRNETWLLFYFLYFKNEKFYGQLIKMFLWIYPVIFFITQYYQSIFILQSISYICGGILIITCCFLFYLYEFQKTETENIFESPYFWFSTGLIIYYALNVPFLGLLPWLLNHASTFVNYYFYVCVLGSSLLLSLFKIKGFLCLKMK